MIPEVLTNLAFGCITLTEENLIWIMAVLCGLVCALLWLILAITLIVTKKHSTLNSMRLSYTKVFVGLQLFIIVFLMLGVTFGSDELDKPYAYSCGDTIYTLAGRMSMIAIITLTLTSLVFLIKVIAAKSKR